MDGTIHLPLYSAVLGGGLVALQAVLMMTVGFYRGQSGQFLGIGENQKLERLFRRHANLAENAGIFMVALAIYEILHGQTALVFWLAVIFGVARVLHAIAFTDPAGSHGINRDGAKRIFVACRAAGSISTAISSIFLGGALVLTTTGVI